MVRIIYSYQKVCTNLANKKGLKLKKINAEFSNMCNLYTVSLYSSFPNFENYISMVLLLAKVLQFFDEHDLKYCLEIERQIQW